MADLWQCPSHYLNGDLRAMHSLRSAYSGSALRELNNRAQYPKAKLTNKIKMMAGRVFLNSLRSLRKKLCLNIMK
ncbi:MAG: hypothetical protein WA051_00845 [Minisyncoccia bacterium]